LYRKPVARPQAVGMAISYGGVLLVFGHEIRLDGAHTVLGSALVFASAASYAVYLVYSGELVKRLGALRLVGLATSVACLCCLLQFALLRPVADAFAVAPPVVWLSLLNATLCTAVPVLLVMMAIERIGPALAAQTGMIGPLSTIALGVWLLGEPFSGWTLTGTAAVLVGIYVVTRSRL
jgi:drug/metabolite transporter (DMT)-like permease